MFENIEEWVRKNIKCCACGGMLETSRLINVIRLDKIATWEFPIFGHFDILGYKPHAAAIVCDECIRKKEKPRYCIEWEESSCQEESPYEVKYHDIDSLEDSDIDSLEDSQNNMNQMKYYYGKKSRLKKLLRRSVRQEQLN